MRLAILCVLVVSTPAFADECAGAAAASEDCNALGKRGAMALGIGYRFDNFDPTGTTFDVVRTGYANTIGRFEGSTLAPIRGNGFYIDVRLHGTPYLYGGVDLGATFSGAPQSTFFTRGGEPITWDGAMVMTMAGLAGVRLPLGPVSLRAELAAGLRGAELWAMAGTPQSISASDVEALVEPRVAADVWVDRWWALELFAGTNALHHEQTAFGLGLAFHSQAFDGRY